MHAFFFFLASPCLQPADRTRRSDEKGRNEAATAAEREIIGEVREGEETAQVERRRDLTGRQTDVT